MAAVPWRLVYRGSGLPPGALASIENAESSRRAPAPTGVECGPASVLLIALQHFALHREKVGVRFGGGREDLVHRHRLDHVEHLLDLRLRIQHQHLAAMSAQRLA